MDLDAVRIVVRRKLAGGELPQERITRFWGGISRGEDCAACKERIFRDQLSVEAVNTTTHQGLQFHIGCFYVLDTERRSSGRGVHVRDRPSAEDRLRLLIITKLNDGQLPRSALSPVLGGHGGGETCMGCEERVPKREAMIEGSTEDGRTIHFHTRCFYIWNSERDGLGRGNGAAARDE